MTRVIKGIYDNVELNTGFFLPDAQVDIICGWLEDYAIKLEAEWVSSGSSGDPKRQTFAKVRSFKSAVCRDRNVSENNESKNGKETND